MTIAAPGEMIKRSYLFGPTSYFTFKVVDWDVLDYVLEFAIKVDVKGNHTIAPHDLVYAGQAMLTQVAGIKKEYLNDSLKGYKGTGDLYFSIKPLGTRGTRESGTGKQPVRAFGTISLSKPEDTRIILNYNVFAPIYTENCDLVNGLCKPAPLNLRDTIIWEISPPAGTYGIHLKLEKWERGEAGELVQNMQFSRSACGTRAYPPCSVVGKFILKPATKDAQ